MYNGDYKSAIVQHAADTGHSFCETDLTILDDDSNWHSRGIRESIFIRALNPLLNHRLNRNDRYSLSPTHDSIRKAQSKRHRTQFTWLHRAQNLHASVEILRLCNSILLYLMLYDSFKLIHYTPYFVKSSYLLQAFLLYLKSI